MSARKPSYRSGVQPRWARASSRCRSRSRTHLALQAAGAERFAVLGCLADEWQQAVNGGLGDQDVAVVTRALEQPGGLEQERGRA